MRLEIGTGEVGLGGGTGEWVAKRRQENINADLSRKVVREESSGLSEFSGPEIKEKQRC